MKQIRSLVLFFFVVSLIFPFAMSTPMLAPYITEETVLKFYNTYSIRDKFNSILPNHILYDLRTKFYFRLKECNVTDNAIKEFVGHSHGTLGNTYTDLSDEYLLKEGQKFLY